MALRYHLELRQAIQTTTNSQIGNAATLEFISNSVGALAPDDSVDAADILATMTLGSPFSSGPDVNAALTANAASSVTADRNGTVGFFRIKNSGGDVKITGTVSLTGQGGDITVDNVNFVQSGTVNLTSFKINEGNT